MLPAIGNLAWAGKRCRMPLKRVSACHAILAASMSPWLPKREAPPRFLLTTSPEGARARHRTGTARIQSPGHVCRPVAMDHLSLRLAALAFGRGDNMLHGRPREPEFPRDRGWFEAGLKGGEDQSLLSRRYGGGPVCFTRFRPRRFWWLGPFHPLPRFGRMAREVESPPPGLFGRRLHGLVELGAVQQAERAVEIGRQDETRRLPSGPSASQPSRHGRLPVRLLRPIPEDLHRFRYGR